MPWGVGPSLKKNRIKFKIKHLKLLKLLNLLDFNVRTCNFVTKGSFLFSLSILEEFLLYQKLNCITSLCIEKKMNAVFCQ